MCTSQTDFENLTSLDFNYVKLQSHSTEVTSFILLFSEVTSQCYKFWKKKYMKKLVDARNNLINMHSIQSLINEFCFDLPLFSKYPATSINSYFYKMTLFAKKCQKNILDLSFLYENEQIKSPIKIG